MSSLIQFQQKILDRANTINQESALSQQTKDAFLAVPRHAFVPRYRQAGMKEWSEVNADNLETHLPIIYEDNTLILFGDDDYTAPSTISQPSFVLYMLDLLRVEAGHSVFELGAGSGWNAALPGQLVGETGRVVSTEIIPEVAQQARECVAKLGIKNVKIISADGGVGFSEDAPYDRAIFTAGSYDLPRHFYKQMKDDGLLLLVVKNVGAGDSLQLLQKRGDHFESLLSIPCGFVQFTGKYQMSELEPQPIEALPGWRELQHQKLSETPFWWSGKGALGFRWRTAGIQSYLGIVEPMYRPFVIPNSAEKSRPTHYFGLWDAKQESLVIAKDDKLTSYGCEAAKNHLLTLLHEWVDLGMPAVPSFGLKIYPVDAPITASESEWIVKRQESQFVWSL